MRVGPGRGYEPAPRTADQHARERESRHACAARGIARRYRRPAGTGSRSAGYSPSPASCRSIRSTRSRRSSSSLSIEASETRTGSCFSSAWGWASSPVEHLGQVIRRPVQRLGHCGARKGHRCPTPLAAAAGATGSPVPCQRPRRAHATLTPSTTRATRRPSSGYTTRDRVVLSRGYAPTPVAMLPLFHDASAVVQPCSSSRHAPDPLIASRSVVASHPGF